MSSPSFKLSINGKELFAMSIVSSLEISDSSGYSSDRLTVSFKRGNIGMPDSGVRIQVHIAHNSALIDMGTFIVDEVSLKKGLISIEAKGFGSETAIKDVRTRSYKNLKTLKAVLQVIADANKHKLKVGKDLENITLDIEVIQKDLSDLGMLRILADKYDATFKIQNDVLLFVKRDKAKSVSGQTLPETAIMADEVNDWECKFKGRSRYKSAEARYHSTDTGLTELVKVGSGEPVLRIRGTYHDKSSAEHAAKSQLNTARQGEKTLSLKINGNPYIKAEAPINIKNLDTDIDGRWIVKSVTHSLSASEYMSQIEAITELKKDDTFILDIS